MVATLQCRSWQSGKSATLWLQPQMMEACMVKASTQDFAPNADGFQA